MTKVSDTVAPVTKHGFANLQHTLVSEGASVPAKRHEGQRRCGVDAVDAVGHVVHGAIEYFPMRDDTAAPSFGCCVKFRWNANGDPAAHHVARDDCGIVVLDFGNDHAGAAQRLDDLGASQRPCLIPVDRDCGYSTAARTFTSFVQARV